MKLLEYVENINTKDRLALFGYGLFETLRVDSGHIEVPLLHYERMCRGTEMLGLKIPDYEIWLASLQELVEKEKEKHISTYALRVTVSGGGAKPELTPKWFYHIRPSPYSEKDYTKGIAVTILSSPRNEYSPLVRIKSTNYIENILAKKEAEAEGAREGIWLNTKGYLAEGTMSNLFIIKKDALYTPSLECGCLPGTRRQLILDCAQKLGVPCEEGEYPLKFIDDAEEIFLTNALMGIMPVCQVYEQRILPKKSFRESLRMEISELYWKTISE